MAFHISWERSLVWATSRLERMTVEQVIPRANAATLPLKKTSAETKAGRLPTTEQAVQAAISLDSHLSHFGHVVGAR